MKRKYLLISLFLLTLSLILSAVFYTSVKKSIQPKTTWKFQSIDTMKYSRDVSREKLNDASFDQTINEQVKNIADTGATHIAIATPYDEEFYPILTRWVKAARKNNLKVWFRGNWSGWEGWFDYSKISRADHIKKTNDFILNHPDLFEDGDVFTACPECENGGTGDPRINGDVIGYRKFLIDENIVTQSNFKQINKDIATNYNSMNYDVAKLIMDKDTTKALGGIVTIDHYVATPNQFIEDVNSLSESSGGKIVIGEFGAPIPDINGQMTDDEQALWLKDTLTALASMPQVVGVSYWTNVGGTTAIWKDDNTPKAAQLILKSFYKH